MLIEILWASTALKHGTTCPIGTSCAHSLVIRWLKVHITRGIALSPVDKMGLVYQELVNFLKFFFQNLYSLALSIDSF